MTVLDLLGPHSKDIQSNNGIGYKVWQQRNAEDKIKILLKVMCCHSLSPFGVFWLFLPEIEPEAYL
jgi:hypothetical protein